MSKKQPFCDSSSHKGSLFSPVKFSLDHAVNRIYVCGCKLSTEAPFCDGFTCQKILKGEKFDMKQDMLYLETEENEEQDLNVEAEQ